MKSNKTFANLKDQITSGNKSIETYEQQMNHLRDKQDKLENEIYNQIQKVINSIVMLLLFFLADHWFLKIHLELAFQLLLMQGP